MGLCLILAIRVPVITRAWTPSRPRVRTVRIQAELKASAIRWVRGYLALELCSPVLPEGMGRTV